MRVLLVEDETIVRRFIITLIDWEAHGFSIAGEASNGEEAWKILEREAVDIVLTDIRMPVCSGFELIERISASGLSCEVVILSSYDDFEYVRAALQLRVSDYVHKATISNKELLNCLHKAKADWLKRQAQIVADRSASDHKLSRKGIVAANLLTMALEAHANERYLAHLSEGMDIWNEPFHTALLYAGDSTEIVEADDGDAIRFAYEDHWIVAGLAESDLFSASWPESVVVQHERPIDFDDWPEEYASLKRELEQRLHDQDLSRSFHASIRQAVDYIQDHYQDELTLEVMSEQVHVSPAYFSRLFQKETGITFTHYLMNVRLEQAKQLLLHSDLPVYDIAERVGYRNTRYFMKLFKETVGCTPTVFRGRPAQEK